MTVDVKALHAELRSIVEGPKNQEGWDALIALLRPLFPAPGGQRGAAPSILARIEEEVFPAIEQTLDRAWPVGLRVVYDSTPPRLKRLGQTLAISLGATNHLTARWFAESRKIKLGARMDRRAYEALLPAWLDKGRYQGLILIDLDRDHVALIDLLLDAGFEQLRYLQLRSIRPQLLSLKERRWDSASPAALVARVIERRAATLEMFRASPASWSECGPELTSLYTPIMRHADALTALTGLGIVDPGYGQEDIALDLLATPALDRLTALSFDSGLKPARQAALVAREGSRNLRRLGVGFIGTLDVPALMQAPNLANVEAWDLRAGLRADEGWDTPEAARWHITRSGRTADAASTALDQAVVDLGDHERPLATSLLFDGDQLRPSARLEALRVCQLDHDALLRLLTQARSAWPNLSTLTLTQSMSTQQLWDAVAATPLLATLRTFSWPLSHHDGHLARWEWSPLAIPREPKAARDARVALLHAALDPDLHPRLACRRWRLLSQGVSRHPERESLAAALGLPKTLAQGPALLAACEARFMELRGYDGWALDDPDRRLDAADQDTWRQEVAR